MSKSEYVYFKSTNFIRFCYFCVAHNAKNFVMKFCILIDYNNDYVLIYFHNFLKLETLIFNFLLNEGSTGARKPKAFSKISVKYCHTTLLNAVKQH
jgi:type IV secretory pathway VirB6-like protein